MLAGCGESSGIRRNENGTYSVENISAGTPDVLNLTFFNRLTDSGTQQPEVLASLKANPTWAEALGDRFAIHIASELSFEVKRRNGQNASEPYITFELDLPLSVNTTTFSRLHDKNFWITYLDTKTDTPTERKSSEARTPISLNSASSYPPVSQRLEIAWCLPGGIDYGLRWKRDAQATEPMNLVLGSANGAQFQTTFSDSGLWRPKKSEALWTTLFTAAELSAANQIDAGSGTYGSAEKNVPMTFYRTATLKTLTLQNGGSVMKIPAQVYVVLDAENWPVVYQGGTCP